MMINRLSSFVFHWVLPLLLLAGAGVAVVMLGSKPRASRKKPPPRVSVPVEIVRAKPHEGSLTISASGVVVPFLEVDLPAEVSGRVDWKSDALRPGRFVRSSDELLRIDRADYELEVARLQQQLEKADADLASAEVDKQNAKRLIDLAQETLALRTREFDRVKMLNERQATSKSELDVAEKSYVEARQLLTEQENLLRGLEARTNSLAADKKLASIGLDKAQLDLKRTTIVAPFSGVVIANQAEANSHVQAGDTIATIEDTSKVEVRFNLRKEDLEFLPSLGRAAEDGDPAQAYRLPPLPVTVTYTRAARKYQWEGVLSRQDGLGMDERTRTMPVRVRVDQPLNCKVVSEDRGAQPIALVRGMFVQVDLHCQPDRPLLAVPEETIRPGKTLWIMQDEKLQITPIQIARIENGTAYVDARDGRLTQQHSIIRSPVPGAKEGLAVTANVRPRAGGPPGGRRGPGAKGPRAEGRAETPRAEGRRAGGREKGGKGAADANASTAQSDAKPRARSERAADTRLVVDESEP